MRSGGAFVNQTTRVLFPAGAQVGATGLVESGSVVGGLNLPVVVVTEELVAGLLELVEDLAPAFGVLPWSESRTAMRTTTATRTIAQMIRRVVRLRFSCCWLMACFSARMARCRARFSLGKAREASQAPPGYGKRARPAAVLACLPRPVSFRGWLSSCRSSE